MSVNDSSGKRRRVNPALLLGGNVSPDVVESDEFKGSRSQSVNRFLGDVKPVDAPVDSGVEPLDKAPANNDAYDSGKGSPVLFPSADEVKKREGSVSEPVKPLFPGLDGRSVKRPVKPSPSLPSREEVKGVKPVDKEEVVPVEEKPVARKPAGGFFLPGEARPVRGGVKKLPSSGEDSVQKEGEDVKGDSVSRKVNPLFATSDKEVSRPAARPSFMLDSDKIPAKRPVDFAKNKTVVEPVVEPVKEDKVEKSVKPSSVGRKPKSAYVSKVDANIDAGEWSDEDEGTSLGLGGEVDARYVEPQYGRGFHLTERDIVLMKFLARYRYAYVDQLARLVDSIPRNIVNRLRVLEKRGFVRKEPITDRQYLWTVRKAGLVLVDSAFREIKKGNLSYATIAHTIGLGNLGIELEREAGGKDLLGEGKGNPNWVMPERRWRLGIRGNPDGMTRGEMTITEREIRQGQMRWRGNRSYKELREFVDAAVLNPDGPELEEGNEGLFVVYGPGGKGGEHVPDLVVQRERDAYGRPEHIAIELELTQKTPTEWRKILRNYRDNGLMYSKVYYFTHKKSIGTALTRIAEEEGFGDKFVVRKYSPINNRMPFWG